jgi:hypothetical protein
MVLHWSLPEPAAPHGVCAAAAAWPLERLEPKALLILKDALREKLPEMEPGAILTVRCGPAGPCHFCVERSTEWRMSSLACPGSTMTPPG